MTRTPDPRRRGYARAATAAALSTALAASLAVSVAGTSGARADSTAAPPPGAATSAAFAGLSAEARSLAADSAAALAAYWTPERMRAATPMVIDDASGADVPTANADGAPGSVPAAAPPDDARLSGPPAASPTVGKVFFTDPTDGEDYICSGAAVNSTTDRLVITAGHCVHGGQGGQFMDNWIFVPRYNYGDRPYGTFAARTYRLFDAWRYDSHWERDVAMVTTHDNEDGDQLVDVVGGNGLAWNQSKKIYLTTFGYPNEAPHFAEWQKYCRGTTKKVIDGRIRLECGFVGGASGGPWLRDYSDATKVGYSNGVHSTLTGSGWNRSPYFDSAVKTMYDNSAGD